MIGPMWTMRLVGVTGALGLLALAGCPRGARDRGPRGAARDGLSIAIYTGYDAEPPKPLAEPAPVPVDPRRPQFQPTPPVPAPVPPPKRRSVAVVDDRRTVEVGADGTVHLAEVAAGIEIASLIIEPLDGRRFLVESCAREQTSQHGGGPSTAMTVVTSAGDEISGVYRSSRDDGTIVIEDKDGRAHFVRSRIDHVRVPGVPASQVRCTVAADAGRHRVRLAYATDDLSWTASYRIDVDVVAKSEDGAATATIRPTYTIAGSGVIGARRAAVSLFVGLPGADEAPRRAWRGEVDLGADEAYVQPAPRIARAHLTHLYRGALAFPDEQPRHPNYWRMTSTGDVWVVLEIDPDDARDQVDLPGGAALVWVTRDATTRQAQARWPEPTLDRAAGIELRLWPSPDLFGYRARSTPWEDQQGRFVEQFLFSVANQSDATATVWVEEELRPGAQTRDVRKMWPKKGVRRGDRMRFRVTVAPRTIERVGFEAEYRF